MNGYRLQKVMVTGAAGFIGSYTLERLLKEGFEVHAVSTKDNENKNNGDVIWHKVDLLNFEEVETCIKQIAPEAIIHFAWHTNPDNYVNDDQNITWLNASQFLLQQFCKYGGKRFIFAGTCFQYDLSYGYLTEDKTPLKSNSLYGICKNNFEQLAVEYCKLKNVSFASGRVFYLYGAQENKKRVVPYVVRSLLLGDVANCSHGNQIRDYLYVEDVANAFVEVLISNVEGAVNIGSGQPVELKTIFLSIAKMLEKEKLLKLGAIEAKGKEPNLIVANNDKLKQMTNWKAKYNLDEGLSCTIDWWKQEGC